MELYKIFRDETISGVFDVTVLVLLQRNKNFALFLPIKVFSQISKIVHENLLCFPPPIIDTDFGEDNPSSKYNDDHKCYVNLQIIENIAHIYFIHFLYIKPNLHIICQPGSFVY